MQIRRLVADRRRLAIVFDSQQGDGRRTRGVPMQAVQSMMTMLAQACQTKGMQVVNPTPKVRYRDFDFAWRRRSPPTP